MRGIVAVFAVSLAACAPFGAADDVDSSPAEEDAPAKKKKATSEPEPGDEPVGATTSTAQAVTTPTSLDGFVGSRLIEPDAEQLPAPGIVVLHGGEGAEDPVYKTFTENLAKRGFVVFAMCWFGCDGRPAQIDRVPLESIASAGMMLRARSELGGNSVGVYGFGRGAEAALLVATNTGPEPFTAVGGHALTAGVVPGYDTQNQRALTTPAWTWGGAPIPSGDDIRVDSYPAPMLLTHGDQDEVWNVDGAKKLVALREQNNLGDVTASQIYPGEKRLLTAAQRLALEVKTGNFFGGTLRGTGTTGSINGQ